MPLEPVFLVVSSWSNWSPSGPISTWDCIWYMFFTYKIHWGDSIWDACGGLDVVLQALMKMAKPVGSWGSIGSALAGLCTVVQFPGNGSGYQWYQSQSSCAVGWQVSIEDYPVELQWIEAAGRRRMPQNDMCRLWIRLHESEVRQKRWTYTLCKLIDCPTSWIFRIFLFSLSWQKLRNSLVR